MFRKDNVVYALIPGEGQLDSIVSKIRSSHEAKEDLVEECGHPEHVLCI
jgi:hypothetical protein